MGTDTGEAHGLARGVVGSARTIAFGTSVVSPAASAATVLVLLVAYAGFASPLVVLITFAGSLCCALPGRAYPWPIYCRLRAARRWSGMR